MRSILEDDAIPVWWRRPVPALDNATPAQVWQQDTERVLALIDAYHSAAYM